MFVLLRSTLRRSGLQDPQAVPPCARCIFHACVRAVGIGICLDFVRLDCVETRPRSAKAERGAWDLALLNKALTNESPALRQECNVAHTFIRKDYVAPDGAPRAGSLRQVTEIWPLRGHPHRKLPHRHCTLNATCNAIDEPRSPRRGEISVTKPSLRKARRPVRSAIAYAILLVTYMPLRRGATDWTSLRD